MNIDEYIKTRVEDQISWYDKKACSYKKWYKSIHTIEIVFAASITFGAGYITVNTVIPIMIGLLALLITIIESITKLNKLHESWIYYRCTSEQLKYQMYLYKTQSYPYSMNTDSIESKFVHNIEEIIASENNQWKMINIETKTNQQVHMSL